MSPICNCGNDTKDPEGICVICRFKQKIPGSEEVLPNDNKGGEDMGRPAKGKKAKKAKRKYTRRSAAEAPAGLKEKAAGRSLDGLLSRAKTLTSEIQAKCAELEELLG